MLNIENRATDERDLDLIGPLWEKLNEHHRVRARSSDQARHFGEMKFDIRKKRLLEKARQGALHLELALDGNTRKVIGYCVSTVTGDKRGEIESILVEDSYRRQGVGDNLMKKSLAWMNNLSVDNKIIEVAVGNEEVLGFYARYGFYPRTLILHGGKSNHR